MARNTLSIVRVCLATGMAVAMPLLVHAQSLGEVARQEEARRKAAQSAGKVYTNGSLPADSAPAPTAPAAPAPVSTPAEPSSGTGKPGDPKAAESAQQADPPKDEASPKDEAYWRKRIQSERDALDRARMFAEALQTRINALTADFANRDDPAQRSRVASDRQKALAELDRVTKEIDQHTRAVAAVQEEARRAGVPAGWVR